MFEQNVNKEQKNSYSNESLAIQMQCSENSSFSFEDNRAELQKARQLKNITSPSQATPIQKQPNNTGLPDNLKTGIENLSGHSMDDVKVHYNSSKPAQMQAHAYAQGTNIHLASGQEKHLPHEAWHIVQQKQGRVKPTMQLKDKVNINDDTSLEQEADLMGSEAINITNQQTNSPSNKKFNPIAQLKSFFSRKNNSSGVFNTVVQRKQLTSSQVEQLKAERERFEQLKKQYGTIKSKLTEIEVQLFLGECNAKALEEYQSKLSATISEYDIFFAETAIQSNNAMSSQEQFRKFQTSLNRYEKSGGRNKIDNLTVFATSLLKQTNKDTEGKISLPPVVRLQDYYNLIEKLYTQALFLINKKVTSIANLEEVKKPLEELLGKVKEQMNATGDIQDKWGEVINLHQKALAIVQSKQSWNSNIKNQFLTLNLIDKKRSLKDAIFGEGKSDGSKNQSKFKELQADVGVMNVASRSLKSEGYYMRSQNVHKMNASKKGKNPFAKRTKDFLEDDANEYNIGGSMMISDLLMEQRTLRPGRKKVSSKDFDQLRDDIINHKNKQVEYIVNNFNPGKNLDTPKAQLDAKYPCVLILFSKEILEKVNTSPNNIPEFLTHLIIGHVNAALIKDGLRPLIERRQSFGFMTPTMTDVHSGVRLSLGITPSKAWCDAVITGLENADNNITSFKDYKSIPGKSEEKNPDFIIMNKFNRGSVLGAGHKLITKILKKSTHIKKNTLNNIFGTRDGEKITDDIQSFKPDKFSKQAVDEESIKLLNRLKLFYENFIEISGKKVNKKDAKWTEEDPGEILQGLMDVCMKVSYDDSRNVVGLDESSDEEDRDPYRVPSGMSALFLPIASYSSIHKDRSTIYDTAPFSYFEIDGSWKRTFKLDYIERLGVRYPLVTKSFKDLALKNFDNSAEQEITTKKQPLLQAIETIKEKGNTDEEIIKEKFRQDKPKMRKEQQDREAEKVEKKIKKIGVRVNNEVIQKNIKINNITKKLNNFFVEQKKNLEVQLEKYTVLMNRYMECKEINPSTDKPKMPKKLKLVIKDLNNLMSQFKKNNKEGNPGRFVARSILSAFEKFGYEEMDKAVHAKLISNVEVAFVDVNPCMTSTENFDSGEMLYKKALSKYKKLQMIVVDITSSTEEQVNNLIKMFQDQKDDRKDTLPVPFMCLAKSGTKHDQLGLDITTMGRCHYIMNNTYSDNTLMKETFAKLKSSSRELSKNTEPLFVKKLRRDLRTAARKSKLE